MGLRIGGLLRPLLSQEQALRNAREASTALARQAVEREDARLYVEALPERAREADSA